MRIYISDDHKYPARLAGERASKRTSDLLAKGLGELGYDVFYHLKDEILEPLPKCINLVAEPRFDVDILHLQDFPLSGSVNSQGKPWVRTYHGPLGNQDVPESIKDHLIFVSESHARCFGSRRYVYNGIDPSEFIYSEVKDNYFLFIVFGLERSIFKGLGIALSLVEELGIKLVVAGSSKNSHYQKHFAAFCKEQGLVFVGEIGGQQKAELIAGAKALLFPTMVNEPFGLVAAEALISGTPVICSNRGACPELISPDVGFVCSSHDEYITAVERIETISPRACREKAMRDFHYLRMAADYVKEYGREIQHF
jgi:glycosyltransferase involved in cell wall biosynthesis